MTGQIALKDVVAETLVVNPPHLSDRRRAAQALCWHLGLENARFSEGTSGLPHQIACTLAHRSAMDAVRSYPCLILEDDVELAQDSAMLGPLPPDADLVYLSVSPFGCLPWTYDNLALARHRALQGLTLASVRDADWLKLHSMSGAQAILYVTQKGRDAWLQATYQAKRFGGPFDVFTAYAMKNVNVYAPHRPVFRESGDLQRAGLRANATLLNKRLSFTRTPLRPLAVGERTCVTFKGQKITVEAVETAPHVLEWSVIDVEKRTILPSEPPG